MESTSDASAQLCAIFIRDLASFLLRTDVDSLRMVSSRNDEAIMSNQSKMPRRRHQSITLYDVSNF